MVPFYVPLAAIYALALINIRPCNSVAQQHCVTLQRLLHSHAQPVFQFLPLICKKRICIYNFYIFKRTPLNEEIWGTQRLLTALHSWVISLRTSTTCYYFRDLHLQETTSSHFLPADPACRQPVPELLRVMEKQLNYSLCDWDLFSFSLWNHGLSQTAVQIILYLRIDSWVLSLQ